RARDKRRVGARLSRTRGVVNLLATPPQSGRQPAGLHFYASAPSSRTHYSAAKSACGTGRGHPAEAAIMEVMSKSTSRRFPVTVTRLPVARCQICDRTVAYRPGKISEVLTEH